ncbi:MAG: YggT family protein [Desulfuromonadales bacterium]|jgi:YggT family protein|nr:YggT family protein [Desulfuromonadales bacterium]
MDYLIVALARIIDLAFNLYIFIVIARALVSWVNPDPYNPIVRFLHNATDPLLYRVRRILPFQMGAFDFSPIVLLLALSVIQQVLVGFLFRLANSL